MTTKKITFIGAGHMATAIIHGLIAGGYPADAITATAPGSQHLAPLAERYHIQTKTDNAEGAQTAEILVLAVKPQDAAAALSDLTEAVRQHKPLIVSIVTGWTVEQLQQALQCQELAIVRCVPNTPALVGSGASGLFASKHCSRQQKDLAETILRAVGITLWIEEEALMNVVTALSGSGPAYFYAVMEALQQAGERLGLPGEIAKLLTLQTAYGAAKIALESDKEVSVLCQQVMSKGGTTEQALNCLNEQQGLTKLFDQAVEAAYKKAEQLANMS